MAQAVFEYEGIKTIIKCLNEDKMRDICKEFISKINIDININNIYLIYNANIINMELKYKEIINEMDKERNTINILVFDKENDNNGIICPICGENIDINLKEILKKIINSNTNINNILNGLKEQIRTIVNYYHNNISYIISQLNNIIYIMNNITEDIKKNNNEIENYNNKINEDIYKNIIECKINIENEDINKDIKLYDNKYIKEDIDIYINNKKLINENKYKFHKKGIYKYKLIFRNPITNLKSLFSECKNLYSINLFYLDTSKVTDISFMLNKCFNLKEIKGINKLNTNQVTNMSGIFLECNELISLDLSNFNTSNVTDMSFMFNKCSKLKEIIGINKFNTNSITNMRVMFQGCSELLYLDLSNFNTSYVTDMSWMFAGCSKLKE